MGYVVVIEGEVREQRGVPWRRVARLDLGCTWPLVHLLTGSSRPTLAADGFTGFPQLEVTWGRPQDSAGLVEWRSRITALKATDPRLDNPFTLSQEEDTLAEEIFQPQDRPENMIFSVTLAALERYPWETPFECMHTFPEGVVEQTTVRDDLWSYFERATALLREAGGDGEDARLIIRLA